MANNEKSLPSKINFCGQELEAVREFKCLDSIISEVGALELKSFQEHHKLWQPSQNKTLWKDNNIWLKSKTISL